MLGFGKAIVKHRKLILLIGVLLLIPCIIAYMNTRINYDMLTYLPSDIDTMKGQDILMDEFGKGGFSLVIVEGMEDKDVAALEDKFRAIDHVESVIWYDDVTDLSFPKEMLPDDVYNAFNNGDATMMAVFFDTSTSADETMEAITQMRVVANEQVFITGMSACVTDLKALCEAEEPTYVALAVVLACAAMMLFMDSYLIPVIFLASIGMAIIWNLGTNLFMGQISYITKALAAVLQLAVTMDYSIFLWHSYEEQRVLLNDDREAAMAHAVANTFTAVLGSSLTTIAGFLALCFMTYTLGLDLGIVMAKGVLLGVIGCVTTLPALILIFDKAIDKTRHRSVLGNMDRPANFITKHYKAFIVLFLVILGPALYGNLHTGVYYDMGAAIPSNLPFAVAKAKLEDDFHTGSTHMILADADLSSKDTNDMIDDIKGIDGVKYVLGADSLTGSIPDSMIPDDIKDKLKSGNYKLLIIQSEYTTASDDVNNQIDEINSVIKQYDDSGMLIGEAPCTKDLITISNHDFQVVDTVSIIAIFLIIAIVLKSGSLPVILVSVIEFAIFINLGIPYYTNQTLPFIAPIVISTIQLGSTVDYAILMTTRYRQERYGGKEKLEAIKAAVSYSIPSIIVSASGFFAATFGVGLYSDIDIISSMCSLMARGAVVSMLSVIFILPSLFVVFDKLICKTSKDFLRKDEPNETALANE